MGGSSDSPCIINISASPEDSIRHILHSMVTKWHFSVEYTNYRSTYVKGNIYLLTPIKAKTTSVWPLYELLRFCDSSHKAVSFALPLGASQPIFQACLSLQHLLPKRASPAQEYQRDSQLNKTFISRVAKSWKPSNWRHSVGNETSALYLGCNMHQGVWLLTESTQSTILLLFHIATKKAGTTLC